MYRPITIGLLIWLGLWTHTLHSAAPTPVGGGMLARTGRVNLWSYAEYLADTLGQYSAQAVFDLPARHFESTEASERNLPVASYPVYVRWPLGAELPDTLYLFVDRDFDRLRLYRPAGLIAQAGLSLPKDQRSFLAHSHVIPLYDTSPGPLLLRIDSEHVFKNSRAAGVQLWLLTASELERELLQEEVQRKRYAFAILFFLSVVGLIGIIMSINYGQTGTTAYGIYALYIGALFLYYAVRKLPVLLAAYHLPPGPRMLLESGWVYVIAYLYAWFMQVFLRLEERGGDDRLLRFLRWGRYGAIGLGTLTLLLLATSGMRVAYDFSVLAQLGYCGIFLLIFGQLFRRRDVLTRYLIAGGMTLLLGMVFIILSDLIGNWTDEAVDLRLPYLSYFQWAVLIELLIFWAGLSYREKMKRRERVELATRLRAKEAELDQLRESALRPDTAAAETRSLALPIRGGIIQVPLVEIAYFRANNNYAQLYRTSHATQFVDINLKELSQRYAAELLRIHKSYLVNRRQISEIRSKGGGTGEVVLNGTITLPVGRTYWPAVRDELS